MVRSGHSAARCRAWVALLEPGGDPLRLPTTHRYCLGEVQGRVEGDVRTSFRGSFPSTGAGRRSISETLPAYTAGMRRVLDAALIVGFLAVDFLFFHDIFKAREVTTVPQYMTGVLSIAVFAICSQSILRSERR